MKAIFAILIIVHGAAAFDNGIPAERPEFPFVVELLTRRTNHAGHVTFGRCMGSIVSPNVVITAAHCVYPDPDGAAANISTLITAMDNQTRTASKFLVHEDFRGRFSPFHDLALLVLNYPLVYNRLVQPIHVPSEDQFFTDGQLCGFANSSNGLDGHHPLHKAEVAIASGTKCLHMFWQLYFYLTPASAVWIESAGHDWHSVICTDERCMLNGDSGGPVVCRADNQSYLCGVTSSSTEPCNGAFTTSFYVKVANYAKWINDRIDQFAFDCVNAKLNCYGGKCVLDCESQIDSKTALVIILVSLLGTLLVVGIIRWCLTSWKCKRTGPAINQENHSDSTENVTAEEVEDELNMVLNARCKLTQM